MISRLARFASDKKNSKCLEYLRDLWPHGHSIDTEKEIDKISCKDQSVSFTQLSDYGEKLDLHVRKHYIEKISVIGIDPVLIPEVKLDPECLPPVEADDLLSFLVA